MSDTILSAGNTIESRADKILTLMDFAFQQRHRQMNQQKEIDVWSCQRVSAVKNTRQGKADGTDGVGCAALYRVVRESLSEELTLGQRHAGGEGVSHAIYRRQHTRQEPQQVPRP